MKDIASRFYRFLVLPKHSELSISSKSHPDSHFSSILELRCGSQALVHTLSSPFASRIASPWILSVRCCRSRATASCPHTLPKCQKIVCFEPTHSSAFEEILEFEGVEQHRAISSLHLFGRNSVAPSSAPQLMVSFP